MMVTQVDRNSCRTLMQAFSENDQKKIFYNKFLVYIMVLANGDTDHIILEFKTNSHVAEHFIEMGSVKFL